MCIYCACMHACMCMAISYTYVWMHDGVSSRCDGCDDFTGDFGAT